MGSSARLKGFFVSPLVDITNKSAHFEGVSTSSDWLGSFTEVPCNGQLNQSHQPRFSKAGFVSTRLGANLVRVTPFASLELH